MSDDIKAQGVAIPLVLIGLRFYSKYHIDKCYKKIAYKMYIKFGHKLNLSSFLSAKPNQATIKKPTTLEVVGLIIARKFNHDRFNIHYKKLPCVVRL